MTVKSQDLVQLETCIKDLKSNVGNKETILHNMARIIKRTFDLTFHITIIDNKSNNFFGMSIYPQFGTVDKIVDSILHDKPHSDTIVELWNKNEEWYLEIDSILLYDSKLSANPAEIVAVILHEIGHVVYSNEVPQRINRVMRYEVMQLDIGMKKLIRWDKVKGLFGLSVLAGSTSKNYHHINLKTERAADKFVVKMGYGDSLDSFIDKLIASQGNSLVNRTEDEQDVDIKEFVNWSVINISELEFRKSKLRSFLETSILKNPSKYIRDFITRIRVTFFGTSRERYKELLNEQYMVIDHGKILTESFHDFFDKYGKIKKMTQYDIDTLYVEKDRIQNIDDKIYVLDLIYDKLDLVNSSIDLIGQGKKDKVPVSKDTLVGFRTQLEKLRKDVLDLQLKPKTYSVMIKYPAGYEG